MNSISEFFSLKDPDSQFFLISFEGLLSNLIAILFWMYVNSSSMNLIFVTSAAVATVSAVNIPTWDEKFKVMAFICACIAGTQFGLTIFIYNKIIILIFMFLFMILIFSIKKYQIFAAMSLFPAVAIIDSNSFTFQAAVNRCLYQVVALFIAYFIAIFFSLIFSNYMIRKSVTSYMYFLLKRFKYLKQNNEVLAGFSEENMNLQKIASRCLFNCVKKQYLIKSQKHYAAKVLQIVIRLFAISRGMLILRNLNRQDPVIIKILDDIELNLEKIFKSFMNGETVNIDNLYVEHINFDYSKYSMNDKNMFVLNNIIEEIQKLDGISL